MICPLLFGLSTLAATSFAQSNVFVQVGDTGVSAQQLFYDKGKVWIVDKVEGNPATVAGHPAWAVDYDLTLNTYRALDITTNSFCAGGAVLGNGSWLNIGGNQAVTVDGVADNDKTVNITEGSGPYEDFSGGRDVRVLTPCSDDTCTWTDDIDAMPINRWYPYLETLEDGSMIVIGGELWGGFVNSPDQKQSNPTYEFWPTRGAPVNSTFLENTQPANLYPLTWILPDATLFMQADWQTMILNYKTGVERALPNITHAQKTYPASGSTAMLPLTPANNYTPTLLFCGGMNPERDDWDVTKWAIANTDTSSSCVSINPMDKNPTWADDDDLPENRGMGNLIALPDERFLLLNGVGKGSAGYGYNVPWAINQSYAQDPVQRPAYYNPNAASGKKWNTTGMPTSPIPRMYHSSATLLPDGTVFLAGSNPNADVINDTNNATYVFKTEYRAEIFYPDYFPKGRPQPTGLPTSLSYGGASFDISLPASSLNGTDLSTVKVQVIRTGFSTHAMNMGQRILQLNNTYTGDSSTKSAVLHVSQIPPNAAIFPPGPALMFVVVNGIPSIGQEIMIGSGSIETQPILAVSALTASSGNFQTSTTSNTENNGSSSDGDNSGSGSGSGSGDGSGSGKGGAANSISARGVLAVAVGVVVGLVGVVVV